MRHHEDVLAERAANAVVEGAEARPCRGDLHRVGPTRPRRTPALGDSSPNTGARANCAPAPRPRTCRRAVRTKERAGAPRRPSRSGASPSPSKTEHEERPAEERPAHRIHEAVERARRFQDRAQGRAEPREVLRATLGRSRRRRFTDAPRRAGASRRVDRTDLARHRGAEAALKHDAHRVPAAFGRTGTKTRRTRATAAPGARASVADVTIADRPFAVGDRRQRATDRCARCLSVNDFAGVRSRTRAASVMSSIFP